KCREVFGVEARENLSGVRRLRKDPLEPLLVPDREQVRQVEVAAQEGEVVVVDCEGDGGCLALGVDAEDHRDRPVAAVKTKDASWRLLTLLARPLERLAAAVPVDQGPEGGVVLRWVAKPVPLDRAHERI